MASPVAAGDGDGFVCGNCQRGRCGRCKDALCTCCYGGDPEPWPALAGLLDRLLRRLAGPLLPAPV